MTSTAYEMGRATVKAGLSPSLCPFKTEDYAMEFMRGAHDEIRAMHPARRRKMLNDPNRHGRGEE